MISDLLPAALGIAVSPFPVIPVILLMFTARPYATSRSFVGGYVLGIAVISGAATFLTGVLDTDSGRPAWVAWVRVVLGIALLVLGVRQWVNRAADKDMPGWMQSINDATPASAFRFGLLLSAANPKVIVFALAAGLAIGAAELAPLRELLTVLAFTALAAVTVLVLVLAHAVLGERVLKPLGRGKDWLVANQAALMAVVFVAVGTLLVVNGVGDIRG